MANPAMSWINFMISSDKHIKLIYKYIGSKISIHHLWSPIIQYQ
uniref:Uncharacterized protein n=1 Tax=Musa acuminata subsp. malaccensis TaxID=214687 RepID=A0A804IQT1_MUSAM